MNVRQGQAQVNGEIFMKNRRTVLFGISLGNPHFSKMETYEEFIKMTERNTDKVLILIPVKIYEHNFRAIGSTNPEKRARTKGNKLRNKCKKVLKSQGCSTDKYKFISWEKDVEPNPKYRESLLYMEDLYKNNVKFRHDVKVLNKEALESFKKGQEKTQQDATSKSELLDFDEGVKFFLKEIAFLTVLQHIYDFCDEFIDVYHRSTPVIEKYFEGFYDGQYKPSYGFYMFP